MLNNFGNALSFTQQQNTNITFPASTIRQASVLGERTYILYILFFVSDTSAEILLLLRHAFL